MMFYKILLFLTIFGCVCGGINASGIFPMQAPVQSTTAISEAQITDLSNSTKGPVSPLAEINWLGATFSIISGAIAALTIIPLGLAWGLPLWLIMIFQVPIWLVELVGIIYMMSGRDMEH